MTMQDETISDEKVMYQWTSTVGQRLGLIKRRGTTLAFVCKDTECDGCGTWEEGEDINNTGFLRDEVYPVITRLASRVKELEEVAKISLLECDHIQMILDNTQWQHIGDEEIKPRLESIQFCLIESLKKAGMLK